MHLDGPIAIQALRMTTVPTARPSRMGVTEDDHPVEYYLHERYREPAETHGLLKAYYAVRPLLPVPCSWP